MQLTQALILGIVEGLTEFIPVSSTGHLILVGHSLGLAEQGVDKAALDAFEIVIQAGAWLACVFYYAPLLIARIAQATSAEPMAQARGRQLLLSVAIAFVPVMALGFLFSKKIKAVLFYPKPVAVALAVGGVVMIALDRYFARQKAQKSLEQIDTKSAVIVGITQCFALIPGTSRSMATILGGLACGFERKAAADFSFLLAVPVLGAATAYSLLKDWRILIDGIGPVAITVGLIASFLVGWASIAGFLRILSRFGLVPFGIYRIVLAAIVWFSLGN